MLKKAIAWVVVLLLSLSVAQPLIAAALSDAMGYNDIDEIASDGADLFYFEEWEGAGGLDDETEAAESHDEVGAQGGGIVVPKKKLPGFEPSEDEFFAEEEWRTDVRIDSDEEYDAKDNADSDVTMGENGADIENSHTDTVLEGPIINNETIPNGNELPDYLKKSIIDEMHYSEGVTIQLEERS